MVETTNKAFSLSGSDWVNDVVDKILRTFPSEEVYTCAAGVTPSGPVHFGNFRDVMISFAIAQELNRRGRANRLLFSWDDFDRFRRVPEGINPSFSRYVGVPLSRVPDPWGEKFSYAERFEKEFETAIHDLGIEMIYQYQAQEYASGRYTDLITHAMQQRHRIAEILLSFMSEKGKQRRSLDEIKFQRDYYPISLYSRFTGKDNTIILDYDGKYKVTYLCRDTGQRETIDFRELPLVKLAWKVDWVMRWKAERVVFEPGGEDHASPGGSYDTSSMIAREIFGIEPPIFVGYAFVNIRGLPGKMSSSRGGVVTPVQLLQIYQPEILKWMYLRKNPSQSFSLAFDTEVYREYEEFDRAVQDFLEHGESSIYARSLIPLREIFHPKQRFPIPFRQAVAFGQIMQWDVVKVISLIERMGFNYHLDSLTERLQKARTWLEEYNPQEIISVRETINQEYVDSMNKEAKQLIRQLRDFLISSKEASIEELEKTLYAIPRVEGISTSELKRRQRAFFKDVYYLLIGRDTGPRLATFIWAIGKERAASLLNI